MACWKLQDAKARFSEFVEAAVKKGPQIVTRRGVETAVLLPIEEWNRLKSAARPTLKEILLGPGPRYDDWVPERRRDFKLRKPVEFD